MLKMLSASWLMLSWWFVFKFFWVISKRCVMFVLRWRFWCCWGVRMFVVVRVVVVVG